LAVAIAKDIPFVNSEEDLNQEEKHGEANAVESQFSGMGYPGMMGQGMMGYPGMMGQGMMGQGMMGMGGPQGANACGCQNTCQPCTIWQCQPCQNPCPPCNPGTIPPVNITPPPPTNRCNNGAPDSAFPDCCFNGGRGQFCCANGANNLHCCLNGANNPQCSPPTQPPVTGT
jgi:hypothetical protein